LSPCLPCSRLIYSAGIKKVFFDKSYAAYKGLQNDEGVDFLNKFGVVAVRFSPL
jgi:dCMP deaminase